MKDETKMTDNEFFDYLFKQIQHVLNNSIKNEKQVILFVVGLQ